MKEIIDKYIDTFKVVRIKMINKIEFENNPMIIHLPEGVGYYNEDLSKESFSKIRIDFEKVKGQEAFTVLVDDFLYIGADFKLTDDENKKARFGKDKKKLDGTVLQEYSSIFARAMTVASAICEGKIKIGERNLLED